MCVSLYDTSYFPEERQSQRSKLKGDKEVAQEQLDKLVAGKWIGEYACVRACVRTRVRTCLLQT